MNKATNYIELPSDFFRPDILTEKPFKDQKIKRFIYKILYPKSQRKLLSLETNHFIALLTAKKWRHLINHYFQGNLEVFDIKPKQDLKTEKIIWQYWGQGITPDTLPEIAKISFNSVDQYKGEYKVIRLDDTTISQYIDLPEFITHKKGKNNFKLVFFSDLLRVALLHAYGGIWMDATIVLTDVIPNQILQKDFFVFQRDPKAKNKLEWTQYDPYYFNWDSTHLVNILSSFMVAKKNNPIIHMWLDLMLTYWKTQDSIYHYFFFQILFEEMMVNDFYPLRGEIWDDTLPHLLQKNMNKPFDPKMFYEISQSTSIHKMTYPQKRIPNSFYDHIASTYLIES